MCRDDSFDINWLAGGCQLCGILSTLLGEEKRRSCNALYDDVLPCLGDWRVLIVQVAANPEPRSGTHNARTREQGKGFDEVKRCRRLTKNCISQHTPP